MSNIACFGESVYSCSLKQGIRDGFQNTNGVCGKVAERPGCRYCAAPEIWIGDRRIASPVNFPPHCHNVPT